MQLLSTIKHTDWQGISIDEYFLIDIYCVDKFLIPPVI